MALPVRLAATIVVMAAWLGMWWLFYKRVSAPSYAEYVAKLRKYDPEFWNELGRPDGTTFGSFHGFGFGTKFDRYLRRRQYLKIGAAELTDTADTYRRKYLYRDPALALALFASMIAAIALLQRFFA
jgi:hypothetical protein